MGRRRASSGQPTGIYEQPTGIYEQPTGIYEHSGGHLRAFRRASSEQPTWRTFKL
ncbi:hypothetical protein QNK09_22360 [Brevibacillus agri]|uniref:hypothetical protein n=1 Tax=Brevibacillus agri TaxID=51101 RepID=UPI0024BF15AF|nr:hypothetical protein [Brevibacillus agri]WHX29777.1 hypothetical protein QNK09_22360 [Brevibacillus agri]